jgi:hypothetical protein
MVTPLQLPMARVTTLGAAVQVTEVALLQPGPWVTVNDTVQVAPELAVTA